MEALTSTCQVLGRPCGMNGGCTRPTQIRLS
jgi:hypothetical protein